MNTIQHFTGPLVALGALGVGFLGSVIGHYDNEQSQEKAVRATNKYDENHDYELSKEEVFKLLDRDKNGKITEDELEYGKKLSNHFNYVGRAMIESKKNIDSVVLDAVLYPENKKE